MVISPSRLLLDKGPGVTAIVPNRGKISARSKALYSADNLTQCSIDTLIAIGFKVGSVDVPSRLKLAAFTTQRRAL